MNPPRPLFLSFVLLCLSISAHAEPDVPGPHRIRTGFRGVPPPETISLKPFGEVGIFRLTPQPHHVAIYMSGDGGWNHGEEERASVIEAVDTMVLGIDMRRYLENLTLDPRPCSDPAGDLDELARAAEKQAGYKTYVPPILVGYSSGATLAYAALAQSKPGTFLGGIGLGFCADFPDKHPFCKGKGLASTPDPNGKGIDFLPAASLEEPFVAFNGKTDRLCARQDVRVYIRQLKKGKLILLPHLGHGFASVAKWAESFQGAYKDLFR